MAANLTFYVCIYIQNTLPAEFVPVLRQFTCATFINELYILSNDYRSRS